MKRKSKIRLAGVIGDDLRVFGLVPYKNLDKEVLREEYKSSQYSVQFLERLISLARLLEKYNENDYYVLIPKDGIDGPLLLRSAHTNQAYVLCPRIDPELE